MKTDRSEYNRQYRQKNKELIAQKRKEKNRAKRKVRDWSAIMNLVRKELADFTAKGLKPTLRAMHYRMYSKYDQNKDRLVQYHNTADDYNRLSSVTAIAREKTNHNNFYGELPINCFADTKRKAIYPKNTEINYEEPEDHAGKIINELINLPNIYEKLLLPRWLNQPHHIEIWTEKDTMVASVESIIGNREIAIIPFGGSPSVSYLWECCTILKDFQGLTYEYKDKNGNIQTGNKKMHIIYLGDLDPSGEVIEESVKKKIKLYGVNDIDFQRLGVTEQQVRDLGLPEDPSPETLAKLEDDPNGDKFKARHNGKLFQIEVDALMAYDSEGFKNMIQSTIDEKFNERIHQEVLERYSSEEIRNLINKSVRQEFNLRTWY